MFLPDVPKGLTGLVTVIKATTAVGSERRRGASVSLLDGDAADGIRPSHCESGEVDTRPMCADVRRAMGRLTAYLLSRCHFSGHKTRTAGPILTN